MVHIVIGFTEPIDDTKSIRVGFEKVFVTRRDRAFLSNYTIRAGAYTEEDHNGLVIVDGDDIHYAAGFGVTIGQNKRLKVEVGLEFGDEEKNYIIAITY